MSVPADLGTAIRQRADTDGWSTATWCSSQSSGTALDSLPRQSCPVAPIGPRRAIARAHLVLYLADDEWTTWQDSACTGGLRTPSRLVSEALASFI